MTIEFHMEIPQQGAAISYSTGACFVFSGLGFRVEGHGMCFSTLCFYPRGFL